jgi:hypothetical protein
LKVLYSCALPPVGVPIDGVAFTASSLVTLPSFPVPLTEVVGIFFHLKLQLEVSQKHISQGVAAAGVRLVQLPLLLQQQEPLGDFCSRTF